jgi:hypothetical protein
VDVIREGTTNNLHTEKYQNLFGKNGCEEEELGLNRIIGDFVIKEVKMFEFLKKVYFLNIRF